MKNHDLTAVVATVFALLICGSSFCLAADEFVPTYYHEVHDGVPQGKVLQQETWKSKIFPGTERNWWIYVPAQYQKDKPTNVMVFQDGNTYINPKNNWRIPIVFDNMIHKGELPVTIGIFIDPGNDPEKPVNAKKKPNNRSYEYDSLGDRYARFLLEEIMPEVAKEYNLTTDPERRAICGSSSGGICSFSVAWERPNEFGKVLTTVGSYTNLRGGNDYAAQIRKTEPKPIRIFMQDGTNDVDNQYGSWPVSNQLMYSSLKYMGYDAKLVVGEGAHNNKHGASIFPDALKWLWRDEPATREIKTKGDLGGDMTLHRLLIDGQGWEVAADSLGFADAPCNDDKGNFYFCDMRSTPPVVWKVAPDGSKTKLIEGNACSGLKFGPDGRLYGCVGKEKQLVAFDVASGKKTVLAENVQPNDLAVTHTGLVFFTETGKKQVSFLNTKTGEVRAADTGITAPNGITVSPDQGILAVSDYRGENVWRFRIHPDGKLSAKERYMTMQLPIDYKGEWKSHEGPPKNTASGGDGMTSDVQGRYYVATTLGVQVFDPTGRLCGVLPKPSDKNMTSVGLAGPQREFLYATCGDKVFRRKVQANGNIYFQKPAVETEKK